MQAGRCTVMTETVSARKTRSERVLDGWCLLAAARGAGSACAALILLLTGCSRAPGEARLDFETHLRDMADPASFAHLPEGQTTMASSFDRTGGNDDWMSLQTGTRDVEQDLLNLNGPGCLTRIWYTGLQARDFRVFIDGSDTPEWIFTGTDMLGDGAPFARPVNGVSSGGVYAYLPVPFGKSLRLAITVPRGVTPDKRQYFHVNAVTYAPGTQVSSFGHPLSAVESNALRVTAEAWKRLSAEVEAVVAAGFAGHEAADFTVAPHQSAEWSRSEGEGLLTSFALRLSLTPESTSLARARALREVVLRMYWDGQNAASVDVPIGDFFCNAFHRRAFASLPLACVDGWYVCRFPMPFIKGMRAEIVNDGNVPVGVSVRRKVSTSNGGRGDARYFHARWTQQSSNGLPLPVLSTRGHGYFVGMYLNAVGMEPSWYILEGDESFRVDGEAPPSWHGTGLEDYFNGAWYYSGLFDLPLHGLLEKAAMRTGQYRFHVHDAVRFKKSLDVQFEFGDQNASKGYMSSVAYWYQDKPAPAGSVIPPAAERHLPRYELEPATVMAEVFELERIGHLAEARERCLAYAEKYAPSEFSDVLAVRAEAYGEAIGGFPDARDALARLAAGAKGAAVAQAGALLWFHDSPANAILGAHVNGRYKLYLDGKLVAEGDHPQDLKVARLVLPPGDHELAAEITPTRADAWFSMCLRTHATNVLTDVRWERAAARPADWPLTSGAEWTAVAPLSAGDMLPRIGFWQFSANAFVGMQSGMQLLRPWSGWPAEKQQATAFVRRRFTVPSPGPAP